MKALVVDDDHSIRTALVATVKTVGCDQVDTAESGEDALGLAARTFYDLVTLDIKMSGVSGIDILGMVRTFLPWTVIAIISGHTESLSDKDWGGAADLVISKPFSKGKIQEIAQIAKDLAEKREALHALDEWHSGADDRKRPKSPRMPSKGSRDEDD